MKKTSPKPNKSMLDKRVGANIRFERERKGISREELAEMLDLTVSHLGLIERGERGTTALTLEKLANILNLPIDKLFNNATDSESSLTAAERGSIDEIFSPLVSGFDKVEMDFIIQFLKDFAALKRAKSRR